MSQQEELPLEGEEGLAVTLYCDGASRGNPGPAAAGALVLDPSGKRLAEVSETLGRTTNNQAEYQALLLGLKEARRLGATTISIYADSQLMIRQILGEYRIKDAGLKPLAVQCLDELKAFTSWKAEHVRREKNKEADALANRALDRARELGA